MFRHCIHAMVALVICSGVAGSAVAVADDVQPWKLIDEHGGLKVYRRDIPGTNLYEFRGVALVEARVPKIVALLGDAKKLPHWVYGCLKGELLEKNFDDLDLAADPSDHYEIVYGENWAPWPLQNRDYILKSSVRFVPATSHQALSVRVTSQNMDYASRPITEGLTRLPLMRIVINLVPVGDNLDLTEIDFRIVMDPGGIIPDAIINLVSRELPRSSLEALGDLVKTEDYNRNLERLVQHHYSRQLLQLSH